MLSLSAEVGYAADPQLYGRMTVWSLDPHKKWVTCKLEDGSRERFREEELAPAAQLWTPVPVA